MIKNLTHLSELGFIRLKDCRIKKNPLMNATVILKSSNPKNPSSDNFATFQKFKTFGKFAVATSVTRFRTVPQFATTIILAFLLPFFWKGLGVGAQTPKLDSLFTLLKTATHDTTLVNTYNALSWEYNRSNPDTALYFANSALKLAIKTNFKKGMAASYNRIGNIHTNNGDYGKAIDFYFKSLKILEELGDKQGMAAPYNNIGNIHGYKSDYDKAIDFYFKSLKIYEELSDKNGMAMSYNNIGTIHTNKGDYDKAIEFSFKSLKISEELGDKKGMSDSYNNIGGINMYKGDYDKAIEFFFKSLKIFEELGDKNGMAASYGNIGLIHDYKGDYDKALDFYFKSLKIFEELGDKNGMANSYGNIGNIHMYKGDSLLDKKNQRDEYDNALDFYFKCLKIKEEIGDKEGMSACYTNIGSLYLKQNKPEEAKKQQMLSLNIALEIGAKELVYSAYSSLAQCDSALGNFRGAYEYHKLYSQIHDSVFSKESNDKITEMGAKYEAEKRELTIQKLEKEKLLQNETLARKEAESKKQRILLFSFLAGFIIILVFSVFLYRLFVQKKMANAILQQQKEEISAQRDEIETQRDLVTEQKEHIEEIHKEVTDSINYAKRIQEAMLPSLSVIARNEAISPNSNEKEHITLNTKQETLKTDCFVPRNDAQFETFILFRPKDVVSGDFYWFSQVNDYQIYAVADCTGHGVPGAFMSMLGISFLNEIVRKKEVTQASHVLDQLRVSIIDALRQTGGSGTQKDGMDMSLVVISQPSKSSELYHAQWAGANNPLWLIRAVTQSSGLLVEPEVRDTDFPNFKNLENLDETTSQRLVLQEVKPDKMPIAIYERMEIFTNHEIELSKGDTIYLMSDGYEDQFGGTKGKKFLSKNLKQLLNANCELTMEEQKQVLEKTLVDWIGEGEQVDDITLLGIKI